MNPVCSKCAATKKSGRLSCCAPGGAWFKNCGTSGNSNADHTWVEGMQACRDVVSFFSGKAEPLSILRNQTTTTRHLNDVEHQNTVDSALDDTYDVPTGNSKSYDQLLDIVVFTTSILFVHHTILLNI